jgi:maltodextrin utilization protein YvdJ
MTTCVTCDFDDWEDFDVPILTENDQKKMEDQQAIEKADILISKDLFDDKLNETIDLEKRVTLVYNKKPQNKKKPLLSNYKKNIETQKKKALKLKNDLKMKKKFEEIFGENDIIDEYDDLSNKYLN